MSEPVHNAPPPDDENKFQVVAYSPKNMMDAVESAAKIIADGKQVNASLVEAYKKLGLDNHEGRKKFLTDKAGITEKTPDEFRIAEYVNDQGQTMILKGHFKDDCDIGGRYYNQIEFTDFIVVPDKDNGTIIQRLGASSFKPLPKAITINVNEHDYGLRVSNSAVDKDGIKVELLQVREEDKADLRKQTTFAALIDKSKDVQLASNARLPGKQQATGQNLAT